ncbi:MAG: hypothetical protein E7627_07730 [Ruminococcaceae bacterium]|nr:hypothetical protein [Oscillospiraceae bacterium]
MPFSKIASIFGVSAFLIIVPAPLIQKTTTRSYASSLISIGGAGGSVAGGSVAGGSVAVGSVAGASVTAGSVSLGSAAPSPQDARQPRASIAASKNANTLFIIERLQNIK